jgi:CheY-like chemotaxis protein
MSTKRVLSVGQCLADHGSISRTLQHHFDVEVQAADSAADALTRLRQEPFALVLINRVFDADGTSGMELIKSLKADESLCTIPIMLVSNYADVQQDAMQAGALPGFGKAALGQPQMLDRVKAVLG